MVVKASATAPGFFEVARMSMSWTISFMRRRLPPAASCPTGADFRRCARTTSAIAWAGARRKSDSPSFTSSMLRRIFSSVFSPNPFSLLRRWVCAALRSVSMSVIPSSCHSCLTFFGPIPRTRSMSSTPGGKRAFSSSWYRILPVVTYSVIFSPSACPIPGIEATRPFRTRSSTSSVRASNCRAARRYEMMRKASSPRMSSMSAISLNRSAIS